MSRALLLLCFTASVPICGTAVAAVYKCADASGKVVIGDRPCVSPQALPANMASTSTVFGNAGDVEQTPASKRAASMARIRAAQTPECLALGDRIVLAANDTRAASAPDMGQVLTQYDKQCAGRAKVAIQAENNRQEFEQKQHEKLVQREATCTEKRRSLDERRAKLDNLNAQDKLAWARSLEEVSRECGK